MWLTDYVIAQILQADYEAREQAQPSSEALHNPTGLQPDTISGAPVLTPEIKQAVADEVKAQVDADWDVENISQSSAPSTVLASAEVPGALDPHHRTFIVSTTLTEDVATGIACSLTPGDVLTRIDDTPDANQNVKVSVAASQRGDCTGSVLVALQDLQDTQNSFHEKVDDGLQQLAQLEGKNGMPAAPTTDSSVVAEGVAQPDITAQADFLQQQESAGQIEMSLKQAAANGPTAQTSGSRTAARPAITSVSAIRPTGKQTIVISGSGFGSQDPFNGYTRYLRLTDVTQANWIAGWAPENSSLSAQAPIYVTKWTDNEITIEGFPRYGGKWVFKPGDVVRIEVANTQAPGLPYPGAGWIKGPRGLSPSHALATIWRNAAVFLTRVADAAGNPTESTPRVPALRPTIESGNSLNLHSGYCGLLFLATFSA